MWKKYLTISTKAFVRTIEYRAEIFLWVILSIIPFGVIMIIWTGIYGQGGEINNFSLAKIIQYYLLVMIIRRVTAAHFEEHEAQKIREGKIDYLLTKPVSYTKRLFFATLGSRFSSLIFASPVLIILIFFSVKNDPNLGNVDAIRTFAENFWPLLNFCVLLIIGYIVEWILAYITVLFAFWYENASGLQHFKWLLITILSGSMVPIPFMPEWLKNLVNQLPFKYLYSVPISVIQDNYLLSTYDWFYIASFVGGLIFVAQIMWKKGAMKYTSAGG